MIRIPTKKKERMVETDIALIVELTIFGMIMIIGCCFSCYTGFVEFLIDQTPQTQQDIETGQVKGLLFKDIKEELEGCGERCCPICLEEYEDDHVIRRLKKCRHVFHRFCINSWLKLKRNCPSCRRSV